MSMLEIRGGGRVIRGAPSPSAETGLFVGRDGLQGWQGLPARRREAMVRALADGEFDVPVRLPARVITIDPGVILARSEFDLQQWCDQANGWGATGAPFDLTVEHLGQTLMASVRVIAAAGEDAQRRAGGFLRGSWSAQLVASDPRKFSTELRRYPVPTPFVGVPVPSRGNFPAHPVVEIADAPTSYSVGSPGGVFAVTGVPAGGTHRIDLASGRVTRNGVWLPNAGRGALWAIPAGESWDVSLTTPGTVLIRDTYV